jgi:hypothetical protein
MKSYHYLLTFLFVLFADFCSNAADLSIYKAGEIQAEAIAFTESENLNDYDSGGGIGLTYWHWAQAGLGFEGKTLDTRHALLDTIGLNLAGRFPVEKLNAAIVTRIGFDWHAEQVRNTRANDFDVYVGLGAEKRFKGYTLGAELRGVRAAELAPDEKLQLLVRVGRAF